MAVNINVPSQVKTYANLAAFPATGALKTIYIAEDTNKTYRWTGSVYVEVSAAGASGITIGSTAITSGTVGRVLFQGTGNVVQQSSSLFWDATNNRLGIGTSTPTQTLDIVGSLNSTSSLNGDLDNLIIRNTLNGAASQTRLRFYNELTPSVTTGGAIFYTSNAYSGFPSNSFGFWNYNTNGVIAFATSVERMRIASTGNVLINTTTDAGFRLDVNGTARVVGPTFAVGDWTQRSTSVYVRALTGGAENRGFYIGVGASNDGNVGSFTYQQTTGMLNIRSPYNSGTIALSFEGNTNSVQFHNQTGTAVSKFFSGTGNLGIGTTTDAGFRLDVNGIGRFGVNASSSSVTIGQTAVNTGYIINATGYASSQYAYRFNNINGGTAFFGGNNQQVIHRLDGGYQGSTTLQINGSSTISGTSYLTSSILELNSTIQGFLPPRMTTTQKNAIATPAAGLVVYDTTLNKLCVYTTAWETVTSL